MDILRGSVGQRKFQVLTGDSLKLLKKLPANSVDSCVCDPPYELGFMGKKWDKTGIANNIDLWCEVLRVLKPGAHLLAFGGTRTYHRMVCAIEDAGFEIRDQIGWLYGSGFPKSLDVSKAIDKRLGVADRRVITHWKRQGPRSMFDGGQPRPASLPASQWQGWGTALKPAWEPIVVARKPLIGTVAENVQRFGTGALNVDASRVGMNGGCAGAGAGARVFGNGLNGTCAQPVAGLGRWPANIIHDGSVEVLAEFAKFGEKTSHGGGTSSTGFWQRDERRQPIGNGDTGTAARFFYCAKASKRDRDEGLRAGVAEKKREAYYGTIQDARPHTKTGYEYHREPRRNHHPTVKPTALMRYLVRMVTPPGGTVLDPFTGSGSTGKAAMLEGFRFIGIELSKEYSAIAKARIISSVSQA